MDVSILRRASVRRLGLRKWAGLSLMRLSGTVAISTHSARPKPTGQGTWFSWAFHEHAGGVGSLEVALHRDLVRTRVKNLIAQNR